LRQLYSQLPEDFVEFQQMVNLARIAWQRAGISYRDIVEMDSYERELLRIALG